MVASDYFDETNLLAMLIKINFLVSYEQSAITYVWKNDEDTLRKSPSLTTLNAYLIQNATTACPIKASWRGKIITIFTLCFCVIFFFI